MGKLEIIVLGVTGFLAFNTYYDNYYLTKIKGYKKHLEIGMYVFLGFSFYLMLKRNPYQSKELLSQASNMVKFLPINKDALSMVSPFLNLTGGGGSGEDSQSAQRILQSGGTTQIPSINGSHQVATKRSVSETKKKWVASQQDWKCNHCSNQLPAWFEVDHKVRLEYGGSNHVDNLEALCRDCHGKKTAMEKF
uniref:HNH nuclease domain-containing protein n=1 Tax=viral metagenome TaxID=1070528 RepID=A0A6C0LUI2_9ZZZZ|tara:strand:- start:7969 stop:8547 length:579 start_codon:yes stop_codon:yes gene_type:complete